MAILRFFCSCVNFTLRNHPDQLMTLHSCLHIGKSQRNSNMTFAKALEAYLTVHFTALRSYWWVHPSWKRRTRCAPAMSPCSRNTRVPRSPATMEVTATLIWTPTSASASAVSQADTVKTVSITFCPGDVTGDNWRPFIIYGLNTLTSNSSVMPMPVANSTCWLDIDLLMAVHNCSWLLQVYTLFYFHIQHLLLYLAAFLVCMSEAWVGMRSHDAVCNSVSGPFLEAVQ